MAIKIVSLLKNNVNNRNGASLLEVLIAMVLLTFVFLGIMGLSLSFINNNGNAQSVNEATEVAQMQTSQFNCLGAAGVQQYLANIGQTLPYSYQYDVSSTANSNPITASITVGSTTFNPPCITTSGNSASPVSGLTQPFTVSVSLSQNPALQSSLLNAVIAVSWNALGTHELVFNEVLS